MARRKILVPEAERALDRFKLDVMKKQGLHVPSNSPEDVKYEVAKEVQVPLQRGYNGHLKSEQAGKVGGQIGGRMVSELIKLAKEKMNNGQI